MLAAYLCEVDDVDIRGRSGFEAILAEQTVLILCWVLSNQRGYQFCALVGIRGLLQVSYELAQSDHVFLGKVR